MQKRWYWTGRHGFIKGKLAEFKKYAETLEDCLSNSGDTILIFSSSFNIKLNMTPQNSKPSSEFSNVSPDRPRAL